MKTNKIIHVELSGGLIGLLFTNPRKALEQRIADENRDGWNAVHFDQHSERNILAIALQLLALVLTLGLWTFGAGYFVLLEREADDPEPTEQGYIGLGPG